MTVETERAYSSDEGIILLLAKKEAYGVLNISITTTKRPRVNETFQLDFGNTASQTWQSLVETLSSLLPEDVYPDSQTLDHILQSAGNMAEEARIHSQSTLHKLEEVSRLAMEQVTLASSNLAETAKLLSLEAAKRSAIISKEVGIQLAKAEAKLSKKLKSLEHLRDPLDEHIMKAQIQSKLFWLRLQGKDDEHREYERRATEVTRQRVEESKKAVVERKKKCARAAKKAAKKEARANKKAAKKGRS